MKYCTLLLLTLFSVITGARARALEEIPFSAIVTKYTPHLCRYESQQGDSVTYADKQTGQLITILRKGGGEGPALSYIITEYRPGEYGFYKAYPQTTADDDIYKLIANLKEIEKMENEGRRFQLVKDWMFSLMKVPGFMREATYEWCSNEYFKYYIDKELLPDTEVLNPKEQAELFNIIQGYHWLNLHTLHILDWFGEEYKTGVERYVYQMLQAFLNQEPADVQQPICDYCLVHFIVKKEWAQDDSEKEALDYYNRIDRNADKMKQIIAKYKERTK